jgi:hypothetical protein
LLREVLLKKSCGRNCIGKNNPKGNVFGQKPFGGNTYSGEVTRKTAKHRKNAKPIVKRRTLPTRRVQISEVMPGCS